MEFTKMDPSRLGKFHTKVSFCFCQQEWRCFKVFKYFSAFRFSINAKNSPLLRVLLSQLRCEKSCFLFKSNPICLSWSFIYTR
jgi:hypothetical protein